jgi:hypothetical protein
MTCWNKGAAVEEGISKTSVAALFRVRTTPRTRENKYLRAAILVA